MGNFEQLKEDLQEKIMQWHDGLESNHAYPHLEKIICDHGHTPNAWNDMDKLCDIVIARVNEYKMFSAAEAVGNVVDGEIYDFGPEC